ncbi:MAG: N-acetylmuramoyl-L-alanine amidase [Anaerolineaceae bacterium]|nr:N-acetylmuramoyl-L-alanine amidase [Anaerolineaceae bacterium]
MPDDQNRPPDQPQMPTDGENDDISPSTIFVEMMREAAAKRAQRMDKREVYRRPKIDRVKHEPTPEGELASTEQHPEQVVPELTSSKPPVQSAEPRPATEPPAPPVSSDEAASAIPDAEPDPRMPTYYEALFEETYPVAGEAEAAPSVKATVHPSVPVYEPTPEELANANKLAEQRVQRVARRKARRRQKRAGLAGGFVYTLLIVGVAACIGSTIFTWFTDPQFFDSAVVSGLQAVQASGDATHLPTTMPTPNWMRRVGIVSGHRGPEDDPGAVCEENGVVTLQEADVNFNVATLVVRNLRERGYSVDLLDEFDTRLENYQAAALVSIHANDCQDYGEVVSGFLVAKASARAEGGPDSRLAECIAQYYSQETGLSRGSALTLDMTDYHSFREIHPLTPAAILELGFLRADRVVLTERTEDVALGITEGIICFLNPTNQPEPTQAAETSS